MKSLYVHIPFCLKKCSYCDFVSFPGINAETVSRYVSAVCSEISSRHELFTEDIETVYFGGGTPSLLAPDMVERILDALGRSCPGFSEKAEISMEVNPGTADIHKLKAFAAAGINRVSLGVQSFNDRLLSMLGRVHTAGEAFAAYRYCRLAGFDNINLDMMFALPGQTRTEWEQDIKKSVLLAPEHVSVYNLQVEEGTPIWSRKHPRTEKERRAAWAFPDEEQDEAMYLFARSCLQGCGYSHYEISNFAMKERECRHNMTYWKNLDYMGVGLAAHSCMGGERTANTDSLGQYLSCPEKAVVENRPATPLSIRQETVFLGLRMTAGVEKRHFIGFDSAVAELFGDGLLEERNGRYRLTLKGLLLGNRVFSRFV